MSNKYTIIVEHVDDEDGTFWYAYIPGCNACWGYGGTETEALKSFIEAREVHLSQIKEYSNAKE